MAVVEHVILRGVSPEQYNAVRAETGWIENPPNGGYSHVAWWDGEDNHNVDDGRVRRPSRLSLKTG